MERRVLFPYNGLPAFIEHSIKLLCVRGRGCKGTGVMPGSGYVIGDTTGLMYF